MQISNQEAARVRVPLYFWQMVAIHIAVVAIAPFYFTWTRFAVSFGLAMWFGHAVGIFHHMLLTHRSFKVVKPIEYLGALLGTLSWRGPMAAPVRYVAMHRIHHMYSDREQDPHSPIHGIWHSLLGWFWWFPQAFVQPSGYEKFAPDVAKDRFLRFLDRNVNLLQAVFAVLVFSSAGLIPGLMKGEFSFDAENAIGYLMFGVFVKSFLVIYLSNAVDVVNHTVGYRNYETGDTSTNSAIMGMIHLGGAVSWHNNHHAHPAYFKVKAQWWEIDVHHRALKTLELFGLASDIKEFDESTHHHESSSEVAL